MFLYLNGESIINLSTCDKITIIGDGKEMDTYFYKVVAYRYNTGFVGDHMKHTLYRGTLEECNKCMDKISAVSHAFNLSE